MMKRRLLWIFVPVLVAAGTALLCFVLGCKSFSPSSRASPPIIIGDGSMFFESTGVQFECKGNEFKPLRPYDKTYKMEWVVPNNGSGKRDCIGDCTVRAEWHNGDLNDDFFIEFKSNPGGMGIKIRTKPDCNDGMWAKVTDPADPTNAIRWKHELGFTPNPSGATITFQASPNHKEEICKGEKCRATINQDDVNQGR